MFNRQFWPAMLIAVASLSCNAPASIFEENFSRTPLQNGWTTFGNPALFQWNSATEKLDVTWDSAQPNSYLLHSLGTILSKDDDFSIGFDLLLRDIMIGSTTNKPSSFQLAVGFLNKAAATATNFIRGTGTDSPNLAEFDYFPDSGFGATVSPTMISSNNQFASSFNFPLEMQTNVLFHVVMNYTASSQTLSTTMTSNGVPFGPIEPAKIAPPFTDFRIDHLAIMSYSDAGQDPQFAGSILAHGAIDDLLVVTPPPPVTNLRGSYSNNLWQASFLSRSNWVYRLERTIDFTSWILLPDSVNGNGTNVLLNDGTAASQKAFYRVRAERP